MNISAHQSSSTGETVKFTTTCGLGGGGGGSIPIVTVVRVVRRRTTRPTRLNSVRLQLMAVDVIAVINNRQTKVLQIVRPTNKTATAYHSQSGRRSILCRGKRPFLGRTLEEQEKEKNLHYVSNYRKKSSSGDHLPRNSIPSAT